MNTLSAALESQPAGLRERIRRKVGIRPGYRLLLSEYQIRWVVQGPWHFYPYRAQGAITLDAVAGAAGWAKALGELDSGIPVREVILTDAALLYAVVPWPSSITSRAELEGYLYACLRDRFGERARQCSLAIRPSGNSLFVCAWPQSLRDALTQAFSANGRPLPAVRPFFPAFYDQVRANLPKQGWLLTVTEGHATVATWAPEGWRSIQVLRVGEDKGLLLPRLKQQAALHQIGLQEGIWLHADDGAWPRWFEGHGIVCHDPLPKPIAPWFCGDGRA